MSNSLTREEILQRIDQNRELLVEGIIYDFKSFLNDKDDNPLYVESDRGQVLITDFISDLVAKAIYKMIDLVYDEKLL